MEEPCERDRQGFVDEQVRHDANRMVERAALRIGAVAMGISAAPICPPDTVAMLRRKLDWKTPRNFRIKPDMQKGNGYGWAMATAQCKGNRRRRWRLCSRVIKQPSNSCCR